MLLVVGVVGVDDRHVARCRYPQGGAPEQERVVRMHQIRLEVTEVSGKRTAGRDRQGIVISGNFLQRRYAINMLLVIRHSGKLWRHHQDLMIEFPQFISKPAYAMRNAADMGGERIGEHGDFHWLFGCPAPFFRLLVLRPVEIRGCRIAVIGKLRVEIQSPRSVRRRRSETGILASDRKAFHRYSFGVPR